MDRRKAHRAPLLFEARYTATNPTPREGAKAVARDISRTGMALVVERPMALKTVVEVELAILGSGQPIKAKGEVIWQRNLPGGVAPAFMAGLQFLEVDPAIQEQIDRIVSNQLDRHRQTLDDKAVDFLARRIRAVREPWPIRMTTLRTTYARVAATGTYLPPTRVTNEDLVKQAGVNLPPILLQRALGAMERRTLSQESTSADMIAEAAKAILDQAECNPEDLDRIICSSDPGDAAAPSTAVAVQAKLGATCPAYDVTMSCAGWICGIDQGLRALGSGEHRVLVLAGCTAGSKVPFRDLKHRAIFGDGAGGLLLELAQERQLLATTLWTDGRFYSRIFSPYPWSVHPWDIPKEYKGHFYMDPDQTVFFDQLTRVLPSFFKRLLLEADVAVGDVDHFLLHQPSAPLFEHSLRLLKAIPRSKVFSLFPKYGNIVAAEMPVLLSEAVESGRIKRGDLICMVTYGAGLTGAGLVMRY